jgi:hypothetical protein
MMQHVILWKMLDYEESENPKESPGNKCRLRNCILVISVKQSQL